MGVAVWRSKCIRLRPVLFSSFLVSLVGCFEYGYAESTNGHPTPSPLWSSSAKPLTRIPNGEWNSVGRPPKEDDFAHDVMPQSPCPTPQQPRIPLDHAIANYAHSPRYKAAGRYLPAPTRATRYRNAYDAAAAAALPDVTVLKVPFRGGDDASLTEAVWRATI